MFEPQIILPKARVVSEPEVKTSKNGKQYLTIRVASQGVVKNKQSQQWEDTPTMWVNMLEFDTSMIAAYQQQLHKGTLVRVEGTLSWRAATDRNGQPTVYYDILWPRISLLISKPKQQKPPQQQAGSTFDNFGQQPPQQADTTDPWAADF